MDEVLLTEINRRAKKELIRGMAKEMTNVNPGGMNLLPSLVRVNCNAVRIENVAIKVA